MSRYIDADKIIYTWLIDNDGKEHDGVTLQSVIDMMPTADVVEGDKAQKEIDYWHDKAQSYEQTILKLSLNKADVVEVVRCKDCKHYKRNIPCVGGHYNGCDEWIDEGNPIIVYDNDYCSYGERADND